MGLSIPVYLKLAFGVDVRPAGEIGRGAFGIVHIAEPMKPELRTVYPQLVVKQLIKDLNESELQLFYQEIAIMALLKDHPNIARIVGYTEKPYCIVMKYYAYSSLDKWIKSGKNVKTLAYFVKFLLDISKGVSQMHKYGIVHCDLKCMNILMDQDDQKKRLKCVITDFGISQVNTPESLLVAQFSPKIVAGGSIKYRLRKKTQVTTDNLPKTDIYSFAIIIFELVTRTSAWKTGTSSRPLRPVPQM